MEYARILWCVALVATFLIAPTSRAEATPTGRRESRVAVGPGAIVTRQGISVRVPRPRESVWGHVLLPGGEERLLGVQTRPDGSVAIHTSTHGAAARASPSRSEIQGACTDAAFALSGFKWRSRYNWYFKISTTPRGVSWSRARQAVIRAGWNITRGDNNCGLPDGISATHSYRGTTSRGANITSGSRCAARDGRSVVAFGDLAGYLGMACWWTRNGSIVEGDVKLNSFEYRWYALRPRGCRNRWSIEAAATHEIGHVFGLRHVSERFHPTLTMSPLIKACQDSEATLGLGDILGLQTLY
jgi:matrixin